MTLDREEADREYEAAQREAHRTLRPSQVDVITREYEASHGRQPRGRGSWAFSPSRDGREGMEWFRGTYSQARRQARVFFAERGVPEIWAQP